MRIRPLHILAAGALLLAGCRREPVTSPDGLPQGPVLVERTDPQPVPQGPALDREELDRRVIGVLEARNDFRWDMVDMLTLWSATLYNDHSVSIGYQPANATKVDEQLHLIDIRSAEWRAVHDALLERILGLLNEGRRDPLELRDILVEDDPVLPILTLRITDARVLTMLVNLRNVRYVEPLDYWPAVAERSTSGCSPSTYGLNGADLTTISPNAKLPWNFNNHSIVSAWNTAQGQGITVGVIDAGLSASQSYLGSAFNDGASNVGRTVTASATLGSSAYTNCSHGTAMSGQAVGPRNGGGASTGVAYKSNLRFIRASEDVVLDKSSERTATKNALLALGADASVRVISMSIGTPFSYSVLSDGVNYAHGMGKMVLAAGGTSFSADSNRNSLSLPPSGATPSYIGGSSSATATAAGIAAVVWSAKPTATRDQVLNCLKSTAQFAGSPSGSKGYGNINAAAAVNCALAL